MTAQNITWESKPLLLAHGKETARLLREIALEMCPGGRGCAGCEAEKLHDAADVLDPEGAQE